MKKLLVTSVAASLLASGLVFTSEADAAKANIVNSNFMNTPFYYRILLLKHSNYHA